MNAFRYTKPIEHKRNKKYGNNYIQFWSRKVGRIVTAYSNLEFYNLIKLEMDSTVCWYCEQPVEACIYDSMGKAVKCYPDVYVCFRDGREEIQEVKYSAEYEGDSPEVLRAWAQRRKEERWSRDNGMSFSVRTEKEILVGKSPQNLRYLCARIRTGRVPEKELCNEITKHVASNSIVTLKDLGDYLDKPFGVIMDCIAYLYWKGIIELPDVISEVALHNHSRVMLKED